MKQLLILLTCLFLSNMSFALPTKKVLVSLKPNERLRLGEYTSNFYADSYNFMCLLYDSETGKKTIIYNGIRKITANDIYIYYIDLDDFNKSIYEYTTDNGKYISIENEIYGPYEEIKYLPIQRILIGIGFILHKWEKSLFMTMMELYAKLAVLNPIILVPTKCMNVS